MQKKLMLVTLSAVFVHAVFGNCVVEFTPGTHELNEDLAEIAVNQLNLGQPAAAGADVLPRITRDIYGNPLSPAQLVEIYGAEATADEAEPPAAPKKAAKRA
jgi:hypothetical protein